MNSSESSPDEGGPQSAAGAAPTLTAFQLKPSPLPIIPAPADRAWMEESRFTRGKTSARGWANRCLPLRVANQNGWLILNDYEFTATWLGELSPDGLLIEFPGERSRFAMSAFGHGILTFYIPYLFRTPPGWNLIVRGPTNWVKDGIAPLDGLIETDWAVASFTMNWKLTRPFHPVSFAAGEPVAMIYPQRRHEVESFLAETRPIESDPELQQGHEAWSKAREELQRQRYENPDRDDLPEWQKHYTLGTAPGGETARQHQVKLDLKPFGSASAAAYADPTAESVKPDTSLRAQWKRMKMRAGRNEKSKK
jgi:hypothetical protein